MLSRSSCPMGLRTFATPARSRQPLGAALRGADLGGRLGLAGRLGSRRRRWGRGLGRRLLLGSRRSGGARLSQLGPLLILGDLGLARDAVLELTHPVAE